MKPVATHGARLLQSVVDDVVSALALAMRAPRAAALLLDADGASCHAIASHGLSDAERERVGRSLAIGDESRPYWQRLAAADGRPVCIAGGRPGESARTPWGGLVDDVPAHVATPLTGSDGRLIGVILVQAAEPRVEDLTLAAHMARVAATAIEQTRTAEARAVELARNAVLLDIMREVDRPVQLPEVLAAICRKTTEAFGARQVTVYFHSRRHRGALPLADYGTPPHVVERFVGGRFLKGTVPHEDEVQAGRIVVIRRGAELDDEDRLLLDATELEVLVFVPLRDDGGVVRGLLSVGYADGADVATSELAALETVGRHAAMAIARARFLDRMAKAARFRAAVSALAIELNAAASRGQTLDLLFTRGCEIFGVDSAALFLDGGDRLVAAATHGDLSAATELVVASDAETPVARAFRGRELVLENDRPRRDDASALEALRSQLAIPLVESEGSIGVLVFGARRPRLFRPHVVEEAPVLGALTAAVLRNLELTGQLQDSNQRLARLAALKDQFLANVSHDLRTPLNVIIGFAQLALEDTFGAPPDELREILGRILASARQQLTLVQDLLDVSRLELNGLSVKPEAVALGPLFADMEFLATSLVRHKPVRVAVEMPRDELWVHADPARLRQILTNLLANAAKFTDAGTIALRAAPAGERVRIDVADSGIGIRESDLEAIFEPFRQVEGERAALGTGLGLAIARRLVTLMHGTLRVESVLGHGSTFIVDLAAAPPADAEATTQGDDGTAAAAAPASPPAPLVARA